MQYDRNIDTTEKARLILDFYFNDRRKPSLDSKIQQWLLSVRNTESKDKALRQIWDAKVGEAVPDRETYESLTEIRYILGFEQKPVKVLKTKRMSLAGRLGRVAAVAACFAMLAAGIWFFGLRNTQETRLVAEQTEVARPMIKRVEAGQAPQVGVSLPDGSQVSLHRGGVIEYEDGFISNRVVRLAGDADFTVTKQNGQPFMVESDGISVEVLGTEFFVSAGADKSQSRVEVSSGSVEVKVLNSVYLLGANEQLVHDKSSDSVVTGRVAKKGTAQRGITDLDFENTPLGEVFERIGHNYGVTIDIAGGGAPGGGLTARFPAEESLEEVLHVIKDTLHTFDFEIAGDRVTITRR